MPKVKQQAKWYRDRNDRMVALSKEGAPICYLSQRFNLSDDTIGRIIPDRGKELPLSKMPPKRDLSDGEFMEKVGHLIRAMINDAGRCVKCGTRNQRIEALYFLKRGGVDAWVHAGGAEVDTQLRRMINEAADGYYKEEVI
jgi:hypothetical protein